MSAHLNNGNEMYELLNKGCTDLAIYDMSHAFYFLIVAKWI